MIYGLQSQSKKTFKVREEVQLLLGPPSLTPTDGQTEAQLAARSAKAAEEGRC